MTRLQAPTLFFMGRTRELSEIRERLTDPSCRLLTLTGLGGAGKTQLALRAAHDLVDAFDSGVVFVPLASLISADDLPAALAYALGIGDVVHDLMGEIYRQADQDRLIVLDNFEHIAGAAPLIGSLLANAPNATLLVTSRTPLNLMEEWVYPVGGMAVTDPQDGAAALFVRHAARVNAKFNGARHSDDVRALCEALDGMPLAIELAATWARLLSPGEILGRLRADAGFLATAQPDRPERQRSLRTVFEYSWSLLSQNAQRTLCGVSVFRGGFRDTLAAEVTGASLTSLTSLAELVDCALLLRLPDGRYQIHPLLRQFGAEKLDEATMSFPTYTAHARAYARLLRDLGPALSAGDPTAVATVADAFEDVRAAVKWLVWGRELAALDPLLTPLADFCRQAHQVADGVALLEAVETLARSAHAIVLAEHARVVRESLQKTPTPAYHALTDREADILRLMAEGLSNAQIADVLTIEVSTVKKHVNNLFRKLNVSSREAAIRITQQPAG